MEFKQDTIGDIIESERTAILSATEKYGDFFINASEINYLLNNFIKSVNAELYFFAIFLSHVRKFHTLALFSAVRLHYVQTGMNIRQVLEAGSWAGFAIGNTEKEKFYKEDPQGFIEYPESLKKQKNTWLEQNYVEGSRHIKNNIKTIGASTGHANIVNAMKNFKFNFEEGKFETPFFDFEDDFHIKTDLWRIANMGYGLMDLFYGINKNFNVIKFSDDFLPRIRELKGTNDKLKLEMMQSDRFKKIKKL